MPCSFESFAPYAFTFAGIGFFSGVLGIVILSRSDSIFAGIANGLLSKREPAKADKPTGQPKRESRK